ncbi:MAG: DUF58 domain-containing protein [Acidimicrobiales bacterium]
MQNQLTVRFWASTIVALALTGLAVGFQVPAMAAIVLPLAAAIAVSIADGWWVPVTVSATITPPRVVEGDPLELTVEVRSERRIPMAELEVQLPATLEPLGPTRYVVPLDGVRQVRIPLRAVRWGAMGPEWAVVTTSDRLGMSQRLHQIPLHLPVRVHPPAEQLSSLVPLYRERPVTGEHHSRRHGHGSELAEVRPYRFGDPVRMISPRLSQRRNEPMVIERHPDRSSDVVLMVDSAQDLGIDLDTTLRLTVTAATALAERHLRAQDRVGLIDVGAGVRWFPTRLGRRHLHQVVDALLATEVQPRQIREAEFRIPANLPRSATVVAISPLLAERTLGALVQLRNRGHEVIVIKPELPPIDPSVSELARRIFRVGNELNERWLIQRGVFIIPWARGDSLDHLMRRVIGNLGRARLRAG